MTDDIARHYARPGLFDAIAAALVASGRDLAALKPADLAPVDAFHIRGRQATVELAGRARLAPGDRVIDIGCGIGGSARHLAAEHGCIVTGVDLSEDYVDAATRLAAAVGLAGRVTFVRGSALALPCADATFDAAWTEHVQMNVADKDAFYGEVARVLRPGGTFLCHDVFAGPGGAPHHPVPWADAPSMSHLVTPDLARGAMMSRGLAVDAWIDCSAQALAWFEAAAARRPGGDPAARMTPALGLHLLMGPTTPAKMANNIRNLREERIVVVQAVARRVRD